MMSEDIKTHADTPRENMLHKHVRVRPFYSVPRGPDWVSNVRSPWTIRARVTVVSPNSASMLIVEHECDHGPWKSTSAYFARELHTFDCECDACRYDGPGLGDEVRNGA